MGKGFRVSHKAQNTFKFQGFGEKVRALRVSAKKYLLHRPTTEEGETTSFLYEAILKARELNATSDFRDFQRELGLEIQTTNQLVLNEEKVAEVFHTHLSKLENMALQPICDTLVAFSNDMPQEFYKKHFYKFFPELIAHLAPRDPETIETIFLCIVSLFIVLAKYLREDLYELYHVNNFANLLSKAYPWYINELAAQALGVLVRKIPKKDAFIGMAFRKLKKDESQVGGLSRVFAAMMKSDIIQRLHSCTPKILGKLLDALCGRNEVPQETALATVKQSMIGVVHYITTLHPERAVTWQTLWAQDESLVWPTLWSCVKSLLSSDEKEAPRYLNDVLKIVEVFVCHKQGALITNMDDVVTNCLAVLETPLPDDGSDTLIEIIATLMSFSEDKLSTTCLQKLILSFLVSGYSSTVKFNFLKQTIDFERFDKEILPPYLPYLNNLMDTNKDLSNEVIELIASVTSQKQPPCSCGMDFGSWKPYVLDFAKGNSSEESFVASFIKGKIEGGIQEDFSNFEELSLCLLCLPHVSTLNHQDLAPYLNWILNEAIAMLKDETHKIVESDKPSAPKKRKSDVRPVNSSLVNIDMNIKSATPLETRRVLFLIGLLVEVMCHIFSKQDFLNSLSQLELLELLKKKQQYRENVHLLKAVDLHFTIAFVECKKDIINENSLKDLYSFLAPSISSSNPQVRLIVLHILSLFPITLPPSLENVGNVENVFQILLQAECVAMTPFDFRDRLRLITSVDAEHVKPHTPVSGDYDVAPLLFLIGQLYTNFKDVWKPVLHAIAGFAKSLPADVFWPIWFSKLKIAAHNSKEFLFGRETDVDKSLNLSCELLSDINNKLSLHGGYAKLPSRIDHLHFRNLLWRAMEKFPELCQVKNRDIVPLFFDFLENEFFPVDFTVSPTQDLRLKSQTLDETQIEDKGTERNVELKDDKQEEIEEADENDASSPKRASVMSLCDHLNLFSKFPHPKMLSQSKRLETMYLELLAHPSPTLQKVTFDCLLTYNHSYLIPYKDHMYKIIEDKGFKNSLTLFSIDGSEKILDDDHRKQFMPYLMRILYGKMHFKTGNNSVGRNKGNVRKGVILRYLAGATEEEFETFFQLSFDVILGQIDGSIMEVLTKTKQNLDLEHIVPLRRLQGSLYTMENIIEKVGNKMQEKKPLILKLLVYILNLSTVLLERRSEMKQFHVFYLKSIRLQAQRQIVTFFVSLEDYAWQSEEIEAVFEAMVWPNLQRLPEEGIGSPVPLMRLFECWSNIPRYFPLLAKVHPEDSTLTPLTYIVKLVENVKCSTIVKSFVFNMIEKLLTLKDHDETAPDEEGRILPLVVCAPLVEVNKLMARDGETEQNYGSALLVPHLEGLLRSMKTFISELGKGSVVSNRDLTILNNLTEWVTTKEISEDLISLLIPLIVNKQVKKEDVIGQLLITCSHLLPLVDNSKQFFQPLVSQLGCLVDRIARDALCKSLIAIASVNPQYKEIANLAAELNSWNPRRVEEPDYNRRLDGYKAITEFCENSESICIEYCRFVVYHNMFVLTNVEDTSLRDMSQLCLGQLIDMCVRLNPKQPAEVKQILIDRLLSEIQTGIRCKSEEVRYHSLFLLQKAVHKCHTFDKSLEDLYKLADEAEDEGDFFSNMMHIQRHRRSRAMMKLADKLRKGTIVLTTETITQFLLPMVRVHLFNDVYAKDDHIIQGSVRCIGAFASLLPWHPYFRMLKSYVTLLQKLDMKYHKLVVKILELIIDGFHEEVEEVKLFEEKKDKAYKKNSELIKKQSSVPKEKGDIKQQETSEKKPDEIKDVTMEDNFEDCDLKEIELADMPIDKEKDSLSKGQKVYLSIVNHIIPLLKKTLSAKTKYDKKHKVNKTKYPQDEDIKRIPLALALVKLMKKLPDKVLDANVNSILAKMVAFLRCQSQVIRDEARAMLVKIMYELGGKYLPWLVSDMRAMLNRGFQTHVLMFTTHAVLSHLRPILDSSHIDSCLVDLVEICRDDMLGDQAEEKKVMKIVTKVKEARNDKGYAILNFAASFISVKSLGDLVMPLKEVLASTQNKKIVNKMSQCLVDIAVGLERNENISLKQKSMFIYGILTEKLTHLSDQKKPCGPKKPEKIQRPDCLILAPEPKRAKMIPQTTFNTTSHLFIEFSLKILVSLLGNKKFKPEDNSHMNLLDPYLAVMKTCLNSEHPNIGIYALKCITLLVTYPLASLKVHIGDMCSEMFIILHKFSSSELAKGKVYELVQLTFRTLAFIIKTVDFYSLNSEELRVLLQYAQESLDDGSHQTTVFPVLQSIVARKVDVPELHELMESVKKMSITSSRTYALNQARVTYYSYLLTYPMKHKKIHAQILYYLGNISYSIVEGRLSAQTFILAVITNFPTKLITKHLETSFWLKLSEQLLQEEFKENRILLQKSLTTLFVRSEKKSYLLDLCLKLLNDDDTSDIGATAVAIQLGCKALSAFLDVPIKKLPSNFLELVAPKIISLTNPSRFNDQLRGFNANENTGKECQKVDNSLIMVLEVLTKLVTLYLTYPEWEKYMSDAIWVNVKGLIFYPHIQVRSSVVGLIGQLLAAHPVDGTTVPCLCSTTEDARSLALDMCEALQTEAMSVLPIMTQLSLSIVRNLIYMIRNAKRVSLIKTVEDEVDIDTDQLNFDKEEDPIVGSSVWVMNRVGNLAYRELKHHGKEKTFIREALLNLMAGVIVVVREKLQSPNLLSFIVKHLARESSDKGLPKNLATRTQEVITFVKEEVGVETYTRHFTKAQVSLSKKRLDRKARVKQQKLVNPDRFLKKKKKDRLASAAAKKLKRAERKGMVISKTVKKRFGAGNSNLSKLRESVIVR